MEQNSVSPETENTAADAPASAEPSASAPRRRGRPRKVVAASSASEDTAPAVQAAEEPPKRRRGRPRKNPAEAAESATEKPAKKTARKSAKSTPTPADSPSEMPAFTPEQVAEMIREQTAKTEQASEEVKAAIQADRPNSGESSHEAHPVGVASAPHTGKNQHERRQRRGNKDRNNNRMPAAPHTSKEELEKMKVAELRAKAEELGVEHKGLLKSDLIDAVYQAACKAEGFSDTVGYLDIVSDGYGFLRTQGYLPSDKDVYVAASMIRRNKLRKGDKIKGSTRPSRPNEKFCALNKIDEVNDVPFDENFKRPHFGEMTPVFPDERLVMEHGKNTLTARVIDLCAPIGKGQRGLIVSPPKAGKTTILKDIAAAISANNPEVHLMCLLVDERPEEVTDMKRSINGEVMASTFDMPSENHIALAEMVIERAKRLVESGKDVVILLDSITRLARAYNLAQPASGRILSGGVDSTALYPPKKFLGAARNIEGGGSLTILASALVDTGSKMDEVIFEEFKGTGNMEVRLDRGLADRRIFPAIDPISSGTRREDLLMDPQEAQLVWGVRRILANRNSTDRAMEMLIRSLKQTNNNQEFLIRAAKNATNKMSEEGFEI